MSEWTKAQEADFQALIHRASEQSRECYRRRKDDPPEPIKYEPPPTVIVCTPEPPCVVPSVTPPPCLPVQESKECSKKNSIKPNAAPQPKPAAKPVSRGGALGGLKALTEKLDNEGIMLAMLLWLLIEEKADTTIILAVAYILLV